MPADGSDAGGATRHCGRPALPSGSGSGRGTGTGTRPASRGSHVRAGRQHLRHGGEPGRAGQRDAGGAAGARGDLEPHRVGPGRGDRRRLSRASSSPRVIRRRSTSSSVPRTRRRARRPAAARPRSRRPELPALPGARVNHPVARPATTTPGSVVPPTSTAAGASGPPGRGGQQPGRGIGLDGQRGLQPAGVAAEWWRGRRRRGCSCPVVDGDPGEAEDLQRQHRRRAPRDDTAGRGHPPRARPRRAPSRPARAPPRRASAARRPAARRQHERGHRPPATCGGTVLNVGVNQSDTNGHRFARPARAPHDRRRAQPGDRRRAVTPVAQRRRPDLHRCGRAPARRRRTRRGRRSAGSTSSG